MYKIKSHKILLIVEVTKGLIRCEPSLTLASVMPRLESSVLVVRISFRPVVGNVLICGRVGKRGKLYRGYVCLTTVNFLDVFDR